MFFMIINNKFFIIDANALPSYKIPNFKSEIEKNSLKNFIKLL